MKELETERMKLRHIRKEDAAQIFACWASDPEVARYVTWEPHQSIHDTEEIVDHWLQQYEAVDCYRYGMELKESGTLIGMIDVVGYHNGNPVIGYCSGRKYWGNGYMTEALQAVVQQLLADGYETLVIEAVKENIGSNRVIQKNGFHHVATREEAVSAAKPEIVTIHSYRLYRKTATHRMQLNPKPFSMIESRQKTIELRLYDEKRRKIAVGDIIEFTNTEDAAQCIAAKVTALHRFPSFAALYRCLPLEKCGYTKETAQSADPADMEQYYTPEKQELYGVVGIGIRVLSRE